MLNWFSICFSAADNKTNLEGDVYPGPSRGMKPDCTVTVEDDDFVKLMVGKLNPQRVRTCTS